MTTIKDEIVTSTSREPVQYADVKKETTFDELVELFGEDHLITALIEEIRELRKRPKRFLVFAGECYYAAGGWHDYLTGFDHWEDALAYYNERVREWNVGESEYDWYQVVDTVENRVVVQNCHPQT